jgi:hypothetical protein
VHAVKGPTTYKQKHRDPICREETVHNILYSSRWCGYEMSIFDCWCLRRLLRMFLWNNGVVWLQGVSTFFNSYTLEHHTVGICITDSILKFILLYRMLCYYRYKMSHATVVNWHIIFFRYKISMNKSHEFIVAQLSKRTRNLTSVRISNSAGTNLIKCKMHFDRIRILRRKKYGFQPTTCHRWKHDSLLETRFLLRLRIPTRNNSLNINITV